MFPFIMTHGIKFLWIWEMKEKHIHKISDYKMYGTDQPVLKEHIQPLWHVIVFFVPFQEKRKKHFEWASFIKLI